MVFCMGGEQNTVRAGSAAVVQNKEGKILLGKRSVFPIGMWVLPGGGINFGETSKDAVVREVREETGLLIEPIKLIKVHELINVSNKAHRIIFFYLAKVASGDIKPSEDISELRWPTPKEIMELDNLGDTVEPILHELGLV